MSLDEMVVCLRDDFGIDVVALQDSAALTESELLTDGEVRADWTFDLVGHVVEDLVRETSELRARIDHLERYVRMDGQP
jgi:hypothetical protein